MTRLLGIDVGTTYLKAVVVSGQGVIQAVRRTRMPLQMPGHGRVELPVDTFEGLLVSTVQQVLVSARCDPTEIEAISYASQANTFALFDREVRPLTPFIVWSDQRIDKRPESVESWASSPQLLEKTGVGIVSDQMCVPKAIWLRDRMREVWKHTRFILTISDYLAYALTGRVVGDTSTASLLGILDVQTSQYWEEGLSQIGLSSGLFAELKQPGVPFGTATGHLSRAVRLGDQTTVIAGCLDHLAAAIGAGLGVVANACESTGTVIAFVTLTERFEPEAGACIGPGVIPATYARLRFDENGARGLDWYRERFSPDLSLDELTSLAAKAPPGCGGLRVRTIPWKHQGSEAFLYPVGPGPEPVNHGLHFRALLEGIAVTLRDLVEKERRRAPIEAIVATGGGARNDLWLQIKADMLGSAMLRTNTPEPAAYGAAALAAKWTQNLGASPVDWQSVDRVFEPHDRRSQMYGWVDEPS